MNKNGYSDKGQVIFHAPREDSPFNVKPKPSDIIPTQKGSAVEKVQKQRLR